ncbi:MAG: helix-turn-helix transcriptional regulator [Nocardioidaceae bacterium]
MRTTSQPVPSAYSAKDQVPRMLALVPYLRGHDGVPVDQVAKDFGVSTQQIVKDLNVLWFCGLPQAVTGEMIDVDMDALEETGVIHIDNAEFLPRPFRMTTHEALALIVALRTLRESATAGELPIIDSALAKLEMAAGDGAASSASVQIHIEPVDESILGTVREALDRRRQLHLTYLVPSRDEQTERDVEPLRLLTAEGRPYLEAWCHRAEDVRLFRLDRVVGAVVLDRPAESHQDVERRDLSAGLFQPGPGDLRAVLELSPNARWIAEYYPIDSSTEHDDGSLTVALRVGDEAWLRRLVLRQGGSVRVVEPADLAEQVAKAAATALAAYDDPS